MSAREQARTAAWENREAFEQPGLHGLTVAIADTVSDVWEPIVRDLLTALEPKCDNSFIASAKRRAQEALNG